MPDDWSPKLTPKEAPQPAPAAPPTLTIVVKSDSLPSLPPPSPAPVFNVRGWRFVPERDANNLIVEIIATPIIE